MNLTDRERIEAAITAVSASGIVYDAPEVPV
jgi:hypothetical protein